MKRSEIRRYPLTNTTLDKLEPESKEYSVHDGNNLYLRVRPNGNKDWRLRYKNDLNKWVWKGLGGYPKVSGKLARQKAKELQQRLAHGEDINDNKESYAFIDLAQEWLNQKDISPKTIKLTTSRLQNYVYPTFGKRDYRHIQPSEWLEHFYELQQETGYIEVIRRTANICSQIYDFAKFKQGMAYNPLDNINHYLMKHEKRNYPHVAQHEIGQLMKDINNYPTVIGRYALLLLAIFHCRPSELITAKWKDIDLDTGLWAIPKENTKTNRDMIRPIPTQALDILHKLKRFNGDKVYLFPNARNDNTHATIEFIEKALHRLGYKGKQTPHGFRHIASTYLNEHKDKDGNKFDDRVIEFALSHTVQGVKGVYNKAQYLNERRDMAQWYADELYRLMNN